MAIVEWSLRTRDPQFGMITCRGIVRDGVVSFAHPSEEGSTILEISERRAEEISSWHPFTQARLNLRIERKLVHTGKEFRDSYGISMYPCPYCRQSVSKIEDDFVIHAIPSCKEWQTREGKEIHDP